MNGNKLTVCGVNRLNCFLINEIDYPVMSEWIDTRIETVIGENGIGQVIFTGNETLILSNGKVIVVGGLHSANSFLAREIAGIIDL